MVGAMSTIAVIVLASVSLLLGVLGTLASSHKETLRAPDGVPYLNPKTFGKDGKTGTRFLIASASIALVSTIVSLIWE